jgi:hypothetical protein
MMKGRRTDNWFRLVYSVCVSNQCHIPSTRTLHRKLTQVLGTKVWYMRDPHTGPLPSGYAAAANRCLLPPAASSAAACRPRNPRNRILLAINTYTSSVFKPDFPPSAYVSSAAPTPPALLRAEPPPAPPSPPHFLNLKPATFPMSKRQYKPPCTGTHHPPSPPSLPLTVRRRQGDPPERAGDYRERLAPKEREGAKRRATPRHACRATHTGMAGTTVPPHSRWSFVARRALCKCHTLQVRIARLASIKHTTNTRMESKFLRNSR